MKYGIPLIISFLFAMPMLHAGGSDCNKCKRIRAANEKKAKDQNWVYYEDWEKLEKDKEAEPKTDKETKEEKIKFLDDLP